MTVAQPAPIRRVRPFGRYRCRAPYGPCARGAGSSACRVSDRLTDPLGRSRQGLRSRELGRPVRCRAGAQMDRSILMASTYGRCAAKARSSAGRTSSGQSIRSASTPIDAPSLRYRPLAGRCRACGGQVPLGARGPPARCTPISEHAIAGVQNQKRGHRAAASVDRREVGATPQRLRVIQQRPIAIPVTGPLGLRQTHSQRTPVHHPCRSSSSSAIRTRAS